MKAAARSATEEREATRNTEKSADEAHAGNRADIFQKILSSDALSPSDKTVDRLAQEGFHAITAGSETTARVLATATYFVLANKQAVMPRLQDELRTVMPYPDSKPPIRDLEQLQWLVGFSHHITSACPPKTLPIADILQESHRQGVPPSYSAGHLSAPGDLTKRTTLLSW